MKDGERFLRVVDVKEITSLGVSTIWKRVADGSLPFKPFKVGKLTVFLYSEVSAWMDAQIRAARSNAA